MLTIHFFFFNDTATTEIYTLSLHDALPISRRSPLQGVRADGGHSPGRLSDRASRRPPGSRRGLTQRRRAPRSHGSDRKSTRLNSSHANISYAVFCLKKKKAHK